MADTGLPWELPYPLPTDLVRDGADAIKDLAEATATGLSAAGNAGIGSNLVQTVKTDTFTLSATTSTPFTDVTGMSVTITPSAATSKILVIVQAQLGRNTTGPLFYRIAGGNSSAYIGDSPGSRIAGVGEMSGAASEIVERSVVYLDSPNTTSPVTYTLQIRGGGVTAGALHLNRSDDDGNNGNRTRGASSITAIEVEA